jgi:hypothetical protein
VVSNLDSLNNHGECFFFFLHIYNENRKIGSTYLTIFLQMTLLCLNHIILLSGKIPPRQELGDFFIFLIFQKYF